MSSFPVTGVMDILTIKGLLASDILLTYIYQYNDAGIYSRYNHPITANFESFLFTVFTHVLAVLCQVCFHTLSIFQKGACSNLLLISRINKKRYFCLF